MAPRGCLRLLLFSGHVGFGCVCAGMAWRGPQRLCTRGRSSEVRTTQCFLPSTPHCTALYRRCLNRRGCCMWSPTTAGAPRGAHPSSQPWSSSPRSSRPWCLWRGGWWAPRSRRTSAWQRRRASWRRKRCVCLCVHPCCAACMHARTPAAACTCHAMRMQLSSALCMCGGMGLGRGCLCFFCTGCTSRMRCCHLSDPCQQLHARHVHLAPRGHSPSFASPLLSRTLTSPSHPHTH